MYLHFIYCEKKWEENIDDYESIGRLTHQIAEKLGKNPKSIYLMDELKTKILDPTDPIIFLKSPMSSQFEFTINVIDKQKGGGLFSFIGTIIKVLILLTIFQVFMISGIFPMLSKLYTAFIDYMLNGLKKGIHYLFKSNSGFIIYMVDGFFFIIKLILQIFSTFLFVYGLTAFIAIKLYSVINPRDYCNHIKWGKIVAKVTTLTYISFYVLLNISNWILFYSGEIVSKVPVFGIVIEPGFMKFSQLINAIKVMPFFVIPFVGPAIRFYFNGVNMGMNQVQLFDNYLKRMTENPTNIDAIMKQFPQLQIMIKENKLEKIFDNLKIAFLPPAQIAKHNISAVELATATLAKNVFLGIVGFFKLFTKMIDDQGGVYELSNIIKTGAIAGAVAVFVFTIALIIFFFVNFFTSVF